MRKDAHLIINHSSGLHARPASLFVKTANQFESEIQISNLSMGKGPVNAKSILSVLTLAVGKGNEILISADGADADQTIEALTKLAQSNFGEDLHQ